MSEPVFLRRAHNLTLAEIAKLTGAVLPAGTARELRIGNVAPLDRAGPADLAFLDKERFAAIAAKTHAGACLTTAAFAGYLPERVVRLIVREPYRNFVMVTRELFPDALRPSSLFEAVGIASAHVHPQARLEDGVTVDPGAVIGPRAEIGADTVIAANAVIGADVRLGRGCAIGPSAIISNALIGDRVIIHPGCKIGQDGFGFVTSDNANLKIPQVGRVIIQDDVEIGAGTTIDRGAMSDTVIGEGSKIDNLVQIGHNVVIGRYCILVAQTGISGSVTIGDYVMLGGQAGVADHVTIGENARVAGQSGVISDIPAGERWGGYPARRRGEWLRGHAVLRRLAKQDAADNSARRPGNDGERG